MNCVGEKVGFLVKVGFKDGCLVGDLDGDFVGYVVGANEGAIVVH